MSAVRVLGRQWDDVTRDHPDLVQHADAVKWLAHATHADPEADGTADEHDLTYHERTVPLRSIRGANAERNNPRTQEAMQGYSGHTLEAEQQTHSVPPVLLVKRGAGYEIADGHHRVTAARRYMHATHINAVVAKSPHKTPLPKLDY